MIHYQGFIRIFGVVEGNFPMSMQLSYSILDQNVEKKKKNRKKKKEEERKNLCTIQYYFFYLFAMPCIVLYLYQNQQLNDKF